MTELAPARVRTGVGPRRRPARFAGWLGLGLVAAAIAGAMLVWVFSNVRLVADGSALAHVELQPFAGSLVSVQARGADGRAVPVVVSQGRLTPRVQVAAGERISISVVVRVMISGLCTALAMSTLKATTSRNLLVWAMIAITSPSGQRWIFGCLTRTTRLIS